MYLWVFNIYTFSVKQILLDKKSQDLKLLAWGFGRDTKQIINLTIKGKLSFFCNYSRLLIMTKDTGMFWYDRLGHI